MFKVIIIVLLMCDLSLVAKEWPCPVNINKLNVMRDELTGMEGFVLKMQDGNMFKWKTEWWRQQRHFWHMNQSQSK